MNYPRKNLIYLKQVYTFHSNQIKFKNPKSTFEKIHRLFLNNLKSEETKSQIKAHLAIPSCCSATESRQYEIARMRVSLHHRSMECKLLFLRKYSVNLEILISTTTNLLHVYYVNIASYKTSERIKVLL